MTRLAPALRGAVCMMLAAGAAWFHFGETSDIWVLLCAAIVFASSYALVRIETRDARAP